jgi:hypothetical protein
MEPGDESWEAVMLGSWEDVVCCELRVAGKRGIELINPFQNTLSDVNPLSSIISLLTSDFCFLSSDIRLRKYME